MGESITPDDEAPDEPTPASQPRRHDTRLSQSTGHPALGNCASLKSSLHRTALSLIERGERDPKLMTLLKVAEKGLGISVAELLGGISLRGKKFK